MIHFEFFDMTMELLANEILMDIFEYLSLNDLFRAFDHLNSRFSVLISSFIQYPSQVNFQCMLKNEFDRICREYLPLMTNRIVSLSLYNADQTPEQINDFFNHGFTLQQFISLKSLSFDHLTSIEITGGWNGLLHLTHLKLTHCYFDNNENEILQWMNSIWALPRLTHCHLGVIFQCRSTFLPPAMISSSIKSLNIQGKTCKPDELIRLFDNTPSLRHLSVSMTASMTNILFPETFSSLISLKLKFSSASITTDTIQNLLRTMCNLRRLTVEILDVLMNGHQWKDLICYYLPNLEKFRLKMEFYFRDRVNTKRYVDQLFQSFQTQFWLEERQWFIRCHFHSLSHSNYVCFYTLPYSFENFPRIEVSDYQSTDPNDDYWAYDRVQNLHYNHSIPSQSIFRKIRSLCLSIDDQKDHFWKIVPSLWHLNTLEVSLNNCIDTGQSEIQAILDQAPHLNFLKFGSWMNPNIPIGELRSSSIRQIDLGESSRRWEKSDCQRLIDSPLGKQCEYLRINVINRMNILYLIDGMISLRALNVQKEGDIYNERLVPCDDELLQWLKFHLPMTCTITRSKQNIFRILIWIR